MDMGKIAAAAETAPPKDIPATLVSRPAEREGSALLGILFLAFALPYWTVRLVGGALWRDLRRVGRFARYCGGAYAEAATRR
jgi:hypothetical protein